MTERLSDEEIEEFCRKLEGGSAGRRGLTYIRSDLRGRWLWWRIRRHLSRFQRRELEKELHREFKRNPDTPRPLIRWWFIEAVVTQKAAWARFLRGGA